MIKKVFKIGNSQAVTVPKSFQPGDYVEVKLIPLEMIRKVEEGLSEELKRKVNKAFTEETHGMRQEYSVGFLNKNNTGCLA